MRAERCLILLLGNVGEHRLEDGTEGDTSAYDLDDESDQQERHDTADVEEQVDEGRALGVSPGSHTGYEGDDLRFDMKFYRA